MDLIESPTMLVIISPMLLYYVIHKPTNHIGAQSLSSYVYLMLFNTVPTEIVRTRNHHLHLTQRGEDLSKANHKHVDHMSTSDISL